MRRRTLAALVALLALAPASARAADADVVRDCQDGKIDGAYSQADYASALRNIPTDVDEYTDCRDVIRRAQLGAAGGKGGAGGTGAGGPTLPPPTNGQSAQQLVAAASPAERAAVAKAIGDAGSAPVVVGGKAISADRSGISPAGAANVVPTPLVIALVLLGLGLLLGGVTSIRTHVLARRAPAA